MTRKRKYELGATGLKFVMGESMRPRRADLKVAVQILDREDLGRFLWPTANIGIGTANLAQLEALVPEMLANARFIPQRFTPKQKACLWIVAWYNHIWLGGVRPDMRSRPRRKISVAPAHFKCPMCGEHWYPPRRVKTQGAAIRAFSVWLKKHSRVKYHEGKETGRLQYRMDEWPTEPEIRKLKAKGLWK